MWMAVCLISVLGFKLGVEFMRLNLSAADSQHRHTSQDIYEVRTFLKTSFQNFTSVSHFMGTSASFFSPRVRAESSRMKHNGNLVLGPLPGARR